MVGERAVELVVVVVLVRAAVDVFAVALLKVEAH